MVYLKSDWYCMNSFCDLLPGPRKLTITVPNTLSLIKSMGEHMVGVVSCQLPEEWGSNNQEDLSLCPD